MMSKVHEISENKGISGMPTTQTNPPDIGPRCGRLGHLANWPSTQTTDELYADRGYDSEAAQWLLAWLGVQPHIAIGGTIHGNGLGRV